MNFSFPMCNTLGTVLLAEEVGEKAQSQLRPPSVHVIHSHCIYTPACGDNI